MNFAKEIREVYLRNKDNFNDLENEDERTIAEQAYKLHMKAFYKAQLGETEVHFQYECVPPWPDDFIEKVENEFEGCGFEYDFWAEEGEELGELRLWLCWDDQYYTGE